jgi:AraC-like DNA-binding protein
LERDSLAAARRAWVDRWLDLHYASPGVTAEQAARAAGISVRYPHRLFEMTSQTFGRALLERRLAAARAALDNPFDQRTITAIAHDCGFLDTAHFTRCFRAAFSLTPSEYRHGR